MSTHSLVDRTRDTTPTTNTTALPATMAALSLSEHSIESKPTLETLAPEIRQLIYAQLILMEREDQQEYAGHFPNSPATCLPLNAIRPPPLSGVSKLFRNEYLSYYLNSTLFRINLPCNLFFGKTDDGGQELVDEESMEWLAANGPSRPAREWLSSIKGTSGLALRNVQYRLFDKNGASLGASLNIMFHPGKAMYQVEYTVDDGWISDWVVGKSGESISAWYKPEDIEGVMKKWWLLFNSDWCVADALSWLHLAQDRTKEIPAPAVEEGNELERQLENVLELRMEQSQRDEMSRILGLVFGALDRLHGRT